MRRNDCEEEHYQIYNIIDRLREEAQRQYGSLYKASKVYGYALNRYLSYDSVHLGFVLLVRICKFLNVSVNWAVFGGEKEPYIDQEITLNNFYETYKAVNKNNCDHNVYVCWWFFQNKKRTSMPLRYLIRTAKQSRKTIDYLIGG